MSATVVSVVQDGMVRFYAVEGEHVEQYATVRAPEGVRPETVATLGLDLAHFGELSVNGHGALPAAAVEQPALPPAPPAPVPRRFHDSSEASVLEALEEWPGSGAMELARLMFGESVASRYRVGVQSALTRLRSKGTVTADNRLRPAKAPKAAGKPRGRKPGVPPREPSSAKVREWFVEHPTAVTRAELVDALGGTVETVTNRLDYLTGLGTLRRVDAERWAAS